MQTEKIVYVGIDIHSVNHFAAIITADGLNRQKPLNKTPVITLGNNKRDYNRLVTRIQRARGLSGSVKIAIDQTGRYSEPLTYFLQKKDYTLYYVNNKAVKAVRKYLLKEENKNDVLDAIKFAHLLYLKDNYNLEFGINRVVAQFDSEGAHLRTLVLQRLTLTKFIVDLTSKIRQLLHSVFPEAEKNYFTDLIKILGDYPTPADILRARRAIMNLKLKSGEQILEAAKTTIGIPGEIHRDMLKYLVHMLNESVAKRNDVSKQIKIAVDSHPYGRILISFPMLGYTGAATLIGVIKNIDNWPDDRSLKKACNVYPISLQSGKSHPKSEPGKEGDRICRGVLTRTVMACVSPIAHENDMRDYYLRLTHRGKPKMKALVSTAGKTVEIIYYCLKNDKLYEYQGKYKFKTSRSTENNVVSKPLSFKSPPLRASSIDSDISDIHENGSTFRN